MGHTVASLARRISKLEVTAHPPVSFVACPHCHAACFEESLPDHTAVCPSRDSVRARLA